MSSATLAPYEVVILGEAALTSAQVNALSNWVCAGGNLIAMRPDKQLAGLLGLTDAAATLSEGYLLVNTATAPGAGIVGQTIQFHGTADRYTLNGATSVATLYSNATRHHQSGCHVAQRWLQWRPGGGLYLRSGPLHGLHPPGQSGLGRAGT